MFGKGSPLEIAPTLPIKEIRLFPSDFLGIEEERVFQDLSKCNEFITPYLKKYDSGPPIVAKLQVTFTDNTISNIEIDLDNDFIGKEFVIDRIVDYTLIQDFLDGCRQNLRLSKEVTSWDFAGKMMERVRQSPYNKNYGKKPSAIHVSRFKSSLSEWFYAMYGLDLPTKSIDNKGVEFHSGYRIEVGKIASGSMNGRYGYPKMLVSGLVSSINPDNNLVFMDDYRMERLIFNVLDLHHLTKNEEKELLSKYNLELEKWEKENPN